MKSLIDNKQFGPWALVTGASSGIGEGFARCLAQEGFQLILVARRKHELETLGHELASHYNTRYKIIQADLSIESAVNEVVEQTWGMEIGLLISNAGTGGAARFFDRSLEELQSIIRLNAVSHSLLTHHFAKKMVDRRRGGILLTGAMGSAWRIH